MKQKSTSMIAVLSVLFLSLLTGVTGQLLGQGGTVVSKFGQAQVAGRNVIVHVTVVVPPGADANQVALDAVRNQGARPFQGDEFSTTGLVWDQFSDATRPDYVVQNYNLDGDPTLGGKDALWSTHGTWTGVSTSVFAFADGGPTTRCPSLVKECKGPQTFDGFNDVGWLRIGGCCTLAVTWFSTSIDEADMALNTNFSWSTAGGDFDVETVILHENGHVAGLGHSEVDGAVMFATYHGTDRQLDQDDINGITFLYPDVTGAITGTVTKAADWSPIAGATVSVDGTLVEATTDLDGIYDIIIAPGTYGLTASAAGFSNQSITEVLVKAATTVANFSLAVDDTEQPNTGSLKISNVASEKSGKGGNFKITWDTNNPANSEITFNCCGTFTNSELVTGHSMSFRGQKKVRYEYWVSSTDDTGNYVSDGPYYHDN